MNKVDIQGKLQDMGIFTDNVYPKSTFISDDNVVVGLYPREMTSDFFFYNNYDKKIYRWKFTKDISIYPVDERSGKSLVPLSDCIVMWEDIPFIEKPDKPFKEMTLREYACIHLKVPDSGLDWLNILIEKVANVTV